MKAYQVTLKVLGVDFSYEAQEILKDITLSLEGGELVGLMGPNGSGKTTLLKVLNGLLKPLKGAVMVSEVDVASLKARDSAKLFGTLNQEYDSSFEFTSFDVVLMGRNPHLSKVRGETKRDYETAIKCMELTNTVHLADRPFNKLSGGEKQRVMIARALAQEPRILLLDEPMSHLDINNQLEILGLLKKLCKDGGLLAIMVVHDFNLAACYCDKIILMRDGRIHAVGSPEEVITEENLEAVFKVRALIRRNPMSGALYVTPIPVLKGPSTRKSRRIHVVSGGGTGVELIKALVNEGFRVTAGVLNVLDSDYEVAADLCDDVVAEAPFSPISDLSHKKNVELVEKSDAVVLTDVPIGWGNLKNLEAVKEALRMGKEVYVLETREGLASLETRDYTGGKASRELEEIARSAVKVCSVQELLEILRPKP